MGEFSRQGIGLRVNKGTMSHVYICLSSVTATAVRNGIFAKESLFHCY
jgi:hypothetical protein